MPYDYLDDTQPRKMGAPESYLRAGLQGMQRGGNSGAGSLAGLAGGLLGAYRARRGQVGDEMPQSMNDSSTLNQAISTGQGLPTAGAAPYVGMPPNEGEVQPPSDGMWKGRIVTKPTRALLGENGPEAVVPLNGRKDAVVKPSMLGIKKFRTPQQRRAILASEKDQKFGG